MSTHTPKKTLGLVSALLLSSTQVSANDVQTIVNDMQPFNDAAPHGLSSDWTILNGAQILAGAEPPVGWEAATATGQVYRDVSDSQDTNTRVELKNIYSYVLSRSTGKWGLLQYSVSVGGVSCTEAYIGACSTPDFKYLSQGSVAVKLAHGRNLFFSPNTSRASIDPNDIAGIFTTVQARLVVDDPSKASDVSTARYLVDMGGDFWRSLNIDQAAYGVNNTQIGNGRFKYVTATWQDFNFTTLTAEEIAKNPPPGTIPATVVKATPTPTPTP
ncbi:MAG: hypothetical protein FIA97_11120, partial [Methylococcaceae bacterium]|nr:hypothetical protein [Methylococcaceae bacterium]